MEQLTLFDDLFNVVSPEDEMIEKALLRGSGFADGKIRIHEFVLTNPSTDKLAKFLKDEYGIGGYGGPSRGQKTIHSESHDGKGIKFEWMDESKEITQQITWNKAAEVIMGMVERGQYL